MRSDCAKGFTLIELLVAFTILSLLAVAAFTGLSVSLSSWTRGNEAVDELRQEQTGRDLMRDQLRSALPFLTGSGPRTIAFAGSAREVEFVTRVSMVDGPALGARWVRWSAGDASAPGRIAMTEHRILTPRNEPESEPYWEGEVAATGEDIEFRYFRPNPNGLGGTWLSSWNPATEAQLPAAVAVVTPDRTDLIVLDSAPASRLGARLE